MVMIVLISGICRRVAIAAMSLLHESENEAGPPHKFSLHTVNDAFLAISASHPTLMVQWCNILILLNYGDQSWWSQLLQTPHMQLSSVSSYVFLVCQTDIFTYFKSLICFALISPWFTAVVLEVRISVLMWIGDKIDIDRNLWCLHHCMYFVFIQFSCQKRLKPSIAVSGKPITELQSITRHMGSHSVTCHPTQVNVPHHNPSQAGWYSIYLPRKLSPTSPLLSYVVFLLFLWP